MSPLATTLAFVLLLVGAMLFLPATARIFLHDDGSNKVMIEAGSGFGLVIISATIGLVHWL